MRIVFGLKLLLALTLVPSAAAPQVPQPPMVAPPPNVAETLAERRKLDAALNGLARGRRGTVEAYVVVVALDKDPVFAREARAAGDVLRRRFSASGRTVVLAGPDGGAESDLPRGSPNALAATLARVGERMNSGEDTLVLYSTSHGTPHGLEYDDMPWGMSVVTPAQFAAMLQGSGITNRLLIVSACFSGIFVPWLRSEASIVITAAAAGRSSFGCRADNDWTFFGDALINRAFRQPQPLGAAFGQATSLISQWETQFGVQPSSPQIYVGAGASRWLAPIERRMPRSATQPVGRPSVETSFQ